MKELLEEIRQFIIQLEKYTFILLGQENIEPVQLLPSMADYMHRIFPAIVESYEREELAAKAEEQGYWVEQLKRISHAMGGADHFFAVDILYFETRENLIQYCEAVENLGLE